ncbi:MAG: 50S ribosomal protein L10, partial [Acinetobacter sp.]|nr:50S ribosomal protein L10 [Acinetobacter sp.]
MPKPPVNAKAKNAKKNNKKQAPKFSKRLVLIGLFIVLIFTFAILWSSLFKAYPIEGKKQIVAEVSEVASKAFSVVVANYQGSSVEQLTTLRVEAR